MSLEEQINKQHLNIKIYTLHFLKHDKPFEYMRRLAIQGYQQHNVSSKESFWYGVNSCLDWYNSNKKHDKDLSTEFYALTNGAKQVLRYVYGHKKNADNKKY